MNDFEALKEIPILCVEDEDGVREVVVDTLKFYFDRVYEARDGEEAYDIYLEHRPKIILTDIQMPRCDGVELVKRIRKEDNTTSIIMLTAYSNEEYLLDLINLNVDHYILKPLNLKKLDDALMKYLDENKSIELHEDLVLDLQKRVLIYQEDVIIDLRKREKDFLELLHVNRNGYVSYSLMEEELWTEKEMTPHALKSFIKELRGKIPIKIIKNIPQEGYALEGNT